MQRAIGVRFKKVGRIYYFDPSEFEIAKDEYVIAETARGVECGIVVISPKEMVADEIELTKVIRKATNEDLEQFELNHQKESEAFDICLKKIAEHKLPMNLIKVEYMFDASKIIFSFTAEGRVDFRELVKDLAYIFHTRIELRQVGVRDEAKLLGGVGCCGRSLCCATFLGDFIPVSIRMAKDQNLSLNPAKISGICGRLMCCLKYENDQYLETNENEPIEVKEPSLNMKVMIDDGEGKVISINRQRKTATIILDNAQTVVASWENIFEIESEDDDVKKVIATVEDNEVEGNEKHNQPKMQINQPNKNKMNQHKIPNAKPIKQYKDNRENRNKNYQRNNRRYDD